jgi:hypothetical protein
VPSISTSFVVSRATLVARRRHFRRLNAAEVRVLRCRALVLMHSINRLRGQCVALLATFGRCNVLVVTVSVRQHALSMGRVVRRAVRQVWGLGTKRVERVDTVRAWDTRRIPLSFREEVRVELEGQTLGAFKGITLAVVVDPAVLDACMFGTDVQLQLLSTVSACAATDLGADVLASLVAEGRQGAVHCGAVAPDLNSGWHGKLSLYATCGERDVRAWIRRVLRFRGPFLPAGSVG